MPEAFLSFLPFAARAGKTTNFYGNPILLRCTRTRTTIFGVDVDFI